MSLPHLQEFDEAPLAQRLDELQRGEVADDVYLAVSEGFWEPEEQEGYETIFAAYSDFFTATVDQITTTLGSPTLRAAWDDSEFPEWAIGVEIAVWSNAKVPFYIRLEHEDREVPIIVALAPVSESDSSD